jgi:hypothetical protein
LEKTEARFLDESGQINLTSELVNTTITELKEFLLALSLALKGAYRAAKEAASREGTFCLEHLLLLALLPTPPLANK